MTQGIGVMAYARHSSELCEFMDIIHAYMHPNIHCLPIYMDNADTFADKFVLYIHTPI